jgi:hypothetical protein
MTRFESPDKCDRKRKIDYGEDEVNDVDHLELGEYTCSAAVKVCILNFKFALDFLGRSRPRTVCLLRRSVHIQRLAARTARHGRRHVRVVVSSSARINRRDDATAAHSTARQISRRRQMCTWIYGEDL